MSIIIGIIKLCDIEIYRKIHNTYQLGSAATLESCGGL